MDPDSLLAKEIYNQHFDQFAEKQFHYNVLQELKDRINVDFLSDVEQKHILFAGCGDGRECLPAAKKGVKITGIDISERAVEFARKYCPLGEFSTMDIEKMTFDNGHFDIVVALFSVIYKANLLDTLKEFRRVLNDDGYIVVAVPHPIRKMMKYNQLNYFVKGKRCETWKGIERFGYYRLIEDYVNEAVCAGLKVIKLIEPKPIKETAQTTDAEVMYPHFAVFKFTKDL